MIDSNEVVDYNEVAKKGMLLAKQMLGQYFALEPDISDMVKDHLDKIHTQIRKRTFATKSDIQDIQNTIKDLFSTEDKKELGAILEAIMNTSLDIVNHQNNNDLQYAFNNKFYSLRPQVQEEEELIPVFENIKEQNEISNILSQKINESIEELLNERLDIDFIDGDKRLLQEAFEKKLIEKIKDGKKLNNGEIISFDELNDAYKKSKEFILDEITGGADKYENFFMKYMDFNDSTDVEKEKYKQYIKNNVFDILVDKDILQNKADNFIDFFKKYVDSNIEINNKNEFFDKYFNLSKETGNKEKLEEWKSLKELVDEVEKIKEGKEPDESIENKLKKFEEKTIKKDKQYKNKDKRKKTLNSLLSSKIFYENLKNFTEFEKEIKNYSPQEMEELKKGINKSLRANHYLALTVKSFGFEKNNKEKLFDENNHLNLKFFGSQNRLFSENSPLLLGGAKINFAKCLSKSLSPKTDFESPENAVSGCIEKYIGELKQGVDELTNLSNKQGVKEFLAFSGFGAFALFKTTYMQLSEAEAKTIQIHIENAYHNFRNKLENSDDINELKNMAKYSNFILNYNDTENKQTFMEKFLNKQIKEGDNGWEFKNSKEFNIFMLNAIKDIDEYHLSKKEMNLEDYIKHLDRELNKILPDEEKEINKIKAERKELGNFVMNEILERTDKAYEKYASLKEVNNILEDTHNQMDKMTQLYEEFTEIQKIKTTENPKEREEFFKKSVKTLNRIMEEMNESEKQAELLNNKVYNLSKNEDFLEMLSEQEKSNIKLLNYSREELRTLMKELKDKSFLLNSPREIDKKRIEALFLKVRDKKNEISEISERLKQIQENQEKENNKLKEKAKRFEKLQENVNLITDKEQLDSFAKELFEYTYSNKSFFEKEEVSTRKQLVYEKMKTGLLFKQEKALKSKIIELSNELNELSRKGGKKNKLETKIIKQKLQIYSTHYEQTINLIKTDLDLKAKTYMNLKENLVYDNDKKEYTRMEKDENGKEKVKESGISAKDIQNYETFIANNANGEFYKNLDTSVYFEDNKFQGGNILDYVAYNFDKISTINDEFLKNSSDYKDTLNLRKDANIYLKRERKENSFIKNARNKFSEKAEESISNKKHFKM